MSVNDILVKVNKERTIYKILDPSTVCSCCKQRIPAKVIKVTFKKPVPEMTIYESEILCDRYLSNHENAFLFYLECQAGKEFVENIDKVEVY